MVKSLNSGDLVKDLKINYLKLLILKKNINTCSYKTKEHGT